MIDKYGKQPIKQATWEGSTSKLIRCADDCALWCRSFAEAFARIEYLSIEVLATDNYLILVHLPAAFALRDRACGRQVWSSPSLIARL